jgi:DNA topoisomerase-1
VGQDQRQNAPALQVVRPQQQADERRPDHAGDALVKVRQAENGRPKDQADELCAGPDVEYARDNESYGLTTLERAHVEIDGDQVRFEFNGKGGKPHVVDVRDPRVAEIVAECQEVPGCELFRWLDADGECHPLDSGDLNDYLREAMGGDFTAKDFRTWAGTVMAVEALCAMEPPEDERQAAKNVVAAIKHVAEELRNTPAVTRQFYVHPAVLAAYEDGTLGEKCANAAVAEPGNGLAELRKVELMTLAVLAED